MYEFVTLLNGATLSANFSRTTAYRRVKRLIKLLDEHYKGWRDLDIDVSNLNQVYADQCLLGQVIILSGRGNGYSFWEEANKLGLETNEKMAHYGLSLADHEEEDYGWTLLTDSVLRELRRIPKFKDAINNLIEDE